MQEHPGKKRSPPKTASNETRFTEIFCLTRFSRFVDLDGHENSVLWEMIITLKLSKLGGVMSG